MTTKNLNVEYEATFCDINVDEIREKIKSLNGKLLKPMFDQKRTLFNLPKGHEIKGGWLRVRDESDKITMTLKIVKSNGSIERQKEIELIVNSYENAVNFLKTIGAEEKTVQETKRELWELDGVQLMIDLWPFLEPVIEIEGKNEADVKKAIELVESIKGEPTLPGFKGTCEKCPYLCRYAGKKTEELPAWLTD